MTGKFIYGFLLMLVFISCLDDSSDVTLEDDGLTGSVTDIDGNTYGTVTIGSQTWMAENLRVTSYADGTPIPLVEDNSSWAVLGENNSDKAYCFYNNNNNGEEVYGALYTYAAAVNGKLYIGENIQGVCPDGWHIPNADEWGELISYVGGIEVVGALLKSEGTKYWENSSGSETNEYYFSALPAGFRYLYDGSYKSIGWSANWWSSSQNTTYDAYAFSLYASSDEGHQNKLMGKSYGLSVRCVKD